MNEKLSFYKWIIIVSSVMSLIFLFFLGNALIECGVSVVTKWFSINWFGLLLILSSLSVGISWGLYASLNCD